jgi:hypothetical protein
LPLRLGEPRHVIVPEDALGAARAPREGELGDAVVEVSRLEVEKAGEPIADEQQVGGC